MDVSKHNVEELALRFIKTGDDSNLSISDLAAACDRLIRSQTQRSASKAIPLGRRLVARARKRKGLLLRTALRALGWALLVAGEYKEAKKIYLQARKLVARDAEARGRIDRVLIDVYMYLGDFTEAQRRARMALATFRRLNAEVESAKTRVNYANLLHRQDRHREAKNHYEKAAEVFLAEKNDLAVALTYFNLGNTLVQLFDFDRAATLYTRAQKIFDRHGHELHAVGCKNGLAWLYMLRGDYHTALEELSRCEATFERMRQRRELVLCRLDRAEAYLGLNLYADARRAAEEAEKGARKLGIAYEGAKGAFFRAKAALGMGRDREAKLALKRAADGFRREQNEPFLAAVQLASTQLAAGKPIDLSKLDFARERFIQAQLPLWGAMCDLQILSQNPSDKKVLTRLKKNPAVDAVPHLYARLQTLLGDREADRNRMTRAVDHWTRAADMLDAVRAKLPPVDMRTSFIKNQSDPYLRLINSELEANPASAAVWAERYKTAGLWATSDELVRSNPVRQKAEASLAELASQVTALSGRLGATAGSRSVGVESHNELARMQSRVREDLAAIERLTEFRDERFENLHDLITEASNRRPLLQFHVGRDDIIAFIHHRHTTRFHRYADGVRRIEEFVDRWRFMVERAADLRGKLTDRDLADERALLAQIGEWLWSPLEIDSRHRRLLILPEGPLSNLPWQALTVGGEPLVAKHEFTFSPSLRHHLSARRRRTASKTIEVFIGTADDLPHLQHEQELFASVGDRVIVHDPARRDDWPDTGSARIWHYAGHAVLRSDNPFYSSLQLADGPLFAADFRLKQNTVGLVTLAACRTAQQTSLPGEESTGLVRSLLEMGAANVLASHWAISDKSTAIWMQTFYKHLLAGQPAGQAARSAMLSLREQFSSAYDWAAFSLFGAG